MQGCGDRMSLIQAVAVVRDPLTGYWSHPGLPDQDGEDPGPFETWAKEQGLYHDYLLMQDDSVSELHPYWSESAAHCIGWEPTHPSWAGPDAFLLSIFDTEEGPAALWVWRDSPGGGAS